MTTPPRPHHRRDAQAEHAASAPPPATRAATPSEALAVAGVLARAFVDDPVQRYLLTTDEQWATRAAPIFERIVRRTLVIGVVEVTPRLEGAALWLPPGTDFMQGPRGLYFALLSAWDARTHLRRTVTLVRTLQKYHPREPHWYLPLVGTDPVQQGRGVGSALLTRALARADAAGLPVYLESSTERNVPFYRRHGFEVVGHIAIPGGPELWPMRREPTPRPA